jgi:signal transduction histidine kinase
MVAEPSGTAPPARHSFGIGARMAMVVCALLGVLTAAGGVWRYLRIQHDLVRLEFIRQRASAESAAAQLTSGIETLRRDVAFLAAAPAVQSFLRARRHGGIDPVDRLTERQWRQRLAELFEARLSYTPEYFQIRLINAAGPGRELIRVERSGKAVNTVSDEQLQEKGQRAYFQQARQSPPGAVYLSRVELNEEHGRISEPRIPSLRAATVIADPGGDPFAILVITKNLQPRFDKMLAAQADRHTLYLFDENLDFLLHPNPSHSFGFQLGTPFRVTQQFPGLRETLLASGPPEAVVDDLLTGESTLATLSRVQPDAGVSSRSFGVLLTTRYADAIAPLIERRWQLVAFNLLVVVVTSGTVLFFSRRLTRPLREITAAVRSFGKGGQDLPLPLTATDEAGVLARAFDAMSGEVRRHAAELEAEVAERRRTAEALSVSEQRLRFALAAARAGAWEWDLTTDKTLWDESVDAMAAIDPKTFRGTIDSWLGLMHPEDVGNVPEAKRQTVEEDQPYAVEFRIRGREGDWRHWSARGDLVRSEDGRPLKLIGISWDVTQARLAEERIRQYAAELERKNREMEQFVYSVSHDLKSPLVTCKGFTGILKEDLAEGRIAEALDSAQRVERATAHMGRLIEDLLQLSRVGRVANKSEAVQVSALVGELAEELRLAAKPGVLVEVDAGMPVIDADPMAISRLFQNLLVNAFQYGCSAAQPRITVGSRMAGGEVLFFVRDNGPGIAAEYHEKIFGLFQRLEANQGGTGIGLAIVSKIMEVHEGRAWVESAPGAGATFWLAFPSHILAGLEPALPRSTP